MSELKAVLENMIEMEIKDICSKDISVCKLEEYKFNMLKIKITNMREEKKEIYIKFISNNRIKESVFCYWKYVNKFFINTNDSNNALNNYFLAEISNLERTQKFKRNISITEGDVEISKIYIVELEEYCSSRFSKKICNEIKNIFLGKTNMNIIDLNDIKSKEVNDFSNCFLMVGIINLQ